MPNLTKIIAAKTIAALIMSISMIGVYAPRQASAALAETGSVNAGTGFPEWYRDANGLTLDLMEAADSFSISDPVDPANPFSEQIGFNAEGFWWSAEASFDNGTQTGLLVLALEAAFNGEAAVDGEQSSFGRIRYRIDGLTPGETYTIRHPYGNPTQVADDAGVINITEDIGCFAIPGVFSCTQATAPNFSAALASGIGPFLTWDTFNETNNDPLLINLAPAYAGRIYVGNPAIDHAITGSPIGQNLFAVEGSDLVAGTQSNLFSVSGRIAITEPVVPVLTTIEVTPVDPELTVGDTQQFSASALDQNGTLIDPQPVFTWTSATEATGTIDASGLFTALAAGTSVITAASDTVSATSTVTVSEVTVPPVIPPTGGGGGGGGGGDIPPQPANTKASASDETVYRFFNKKKGTYFFTASKMERDEVIEKLAKDWKYEGESYKVFGRKVEGTVPVYRFFDKKRNVHFYTSSETERDELIKKSSKTWRFEGEAYNVFQGQVEGTVPIYRLFDKKKGTHLFTASEDERNKFKSDKNWRDEGIAWYASL